MVMGDKAMPFTSTIGGRLDRRILYPVYNEMKSGCPKDVLNRDANESKMSEIHS